MTASEPMFRRRDRAESFGRAAEAYDRFRPTYPEALVADLLATGAQDVLDVGCGTGKLARLLGTRGVRVLGVEVDPAMAAVADRSGLDVEVASFEGWDAQERRFDLITCGQAWHWLDPAVAIGKAAGLLRPGGTLALVWNYGRFDRPVRAALDAVYARITPELAESVVAGGGANQSEGEHADRLRASGRFQAVESRSYRWQQDYSADEWTSLVQTHSDHLALDPEVRADLAAALGTTIGELGGRVRVHYTTYAVYAAAGTGEGG